MTNMKNTTCEFTNFSDVLKYIINDDKYGESALRNRERTENIINDLVPDSFQKEKKLLGDAYYCKVIRLMLDANSSSGKHDIALNSAKIKLVKDAGMSEESAAEILKCISFALGWKEDIKSNKKNNSPNSSPGKQKDDTELNASAEKEVAFYREAKPQEKKKKKFPIVILLFIAILVCIIWPFGGKEEDNSVIDEGKTAETEDTTVLQNISAANESVEMESKPIAVEAEPVEEPPVAVEEEPVEEAPIAVEEEPEKVVADEPIEDELSKYIISEIDSADWENLHEFITHTAYVPQSNLFYYLNVTGEELYCYNLETKEREVVLSISQIKDLCEENWPQFESSQTLLTSSDSKKEICVYGLLFNPYNSEIFICGFFPDEYGEKSWWFYNVFDNFFSFGFSFTDIGLEDGNSTKDSILLKNRIFFVSEDEYYYLNNSKYSGYTGDAYICKIGEKTVDFNVGIWDGFDYLIDHNDTYYIIECFYQEAYLYEVGSIYSTPEFAFDDMIGLFSKENVSVYESIGFCYYNDHLYMKDEFNDIYVIDIDNLTKDLYISYADMKETGKLFLGDEACFGLHMTNDGGYITFDSSNRKIKYVKCNN